MENKALKIAISGNIGVGKSTLTEALAKELKGHLLKEEVDKEMLDLFYKHLEDPTKYENIELLHQFNFLSSTLKRDIKAQMVFGEGDILIIDRPITDHIEVFAKLNLTPKEYRNYALLQEQFSILLGREDYDLTILLVDSVQGLSEKVKKRGRKSEKEMSSEYLKDLNNIYNSPRFKESLLAHSKEVWVLDVGGLDEAEVLREVMDEIKREPEKGAK